MKKLLLLLSAVSFLIVSCGDKKSEDKGIENANKEEIIFETPDGLKISGDYFSSSEKSEDKKPCVILIHQFNSNREQWQNKLIGELLENSFNVIRYDIRSHGKSDKANVPIQELLSDIQQSPKDLVSVINWARNRDEIDPSRIGVAGTSIGAALALNAAHYLGIKSFVAISLGKYTYEKLTGNYEELLGAKVIPRVPNGMLICGTKDGNYAKESQVIFDNYLMEPKEYKQFESDKHGKDLMADFPGINDLILDWFKKHL
ncbi:MAG: alpha/beta fold hydrolase [Ignavibacteria bacterium]|nr:alpha/beta fold hydrolase [Ignavibacteria bacterium]